MRDTLGCDKFVYFMYREDNDWIKIGISKRPYRRREEVQKDARTHVSLLPMLMIPDTYYDSAYQLEQNLHAKFKEFRMDGEWFKKDGVKSLIKWSVNSRWGYLVPSYFRDCTDNSIIHTTPEHSTAMYLPAKYANVKYLSDQKHPSTGVYYKAKINNKTLNLVGNYVLNNFEQYDSELRKLRYI